MNYEYALNYSVRKILELFNTKFRALVSASENDTEVVGYKSIAAYRTGLAVSTSGSKADIEISLSEAVNGYYDNGRRKLRLQHKAFNDHFVRMALDIVKKPGQFFECRIRPTLMTSIIHSTIPHRLG